ncbi:MAG TPA: hypothetical protein VK251_03715 [Steroidobacteraceae bacterium]|nr:hypothetical protein [Steroidobacteraceae bacterium]
MNAALKPANKPPTIALAREALAAHERELLEARRANSAARAAISGYRANAEEAAEQQCKRTIATSAKQIEELTSVIAIDQASLEVVLAREVSVGNAKRYRNLETLAAAMVSASGALEDLTIQWAAARSMAREVAAEFESELNRCNVSYDAFLSAATRLDSRAEMLLWVETGGTFGRARTLETPEQIKQNGRASLHLAATEFRGVALRSARMTLGYSANEVS